MNHRIYETVGGRRCPVSATCTCGWTAPVTDGHWLDVARQHHDEMIATDPSVFVAFGYEGDRSHLAASLARR